MRKDFLISAVAVAMATTSTAGCGVGEGSGYANGMLWILGCREGLPEGTQDAPQVFHLDPTFFVGEPIEDITDGPPVNRLIIRLQRNGNAVEINDTLYFDVRDSTEVARCLRGRTVGGVPDWDTSTGSVDPAVTTPWCEQSADPTQLPAIHLVPFGPVAVSFAPLASCHSNMHPPSIVNINGVAQEGHVYFTSFGGAVQGNQANIDPEMRQKIDVDKGFRVNYGDSLVADFDFVMEDERVAAALRDKKTPPQNPVIGGNLAGHFDFDLARGRAAQTFP